MPVVTLANGNQYEASAGATLLDAALAHGVVLEHSCRTGRCGSCKARVTHGQTVAQRPPVALTDDEASHGWVLTCTNEATLELPLRTLAWPLVFWMAVPTLLLMSTLSMISVPLVKLDEVW